MLAGIVAAFHDGVEIGIGADQIEVRRDARDHLELGTPNPDLAGLHRKHGAAGIARQPHALFGNRNQTGNG
jgi:hypothetical protein